jgi:Ca2+-binding RTX toxin-like protein
MPTFTGTDADETITPTTVSPSVTASGAATPSDLADTINAGGGRDIIDGGGGADTIDGGAGDDQVSGGAGDDTIQLGAGLNTFLWKVGDGSDTVDGGGDSDIFIFSGGADVDSFELAALAGRLKVTRDTSIVSAGVAQFDSVTIVAAAGADQIALHDVSGLGIARVTVDLRGPPDPANPNAGDGAADRIILDGKATNDTINISNLFGPVGMGTLLVQGFQHQLILQGLEVQDTITVNGLAGDDVLGTGGEIGTSVILLPVNFALALDGGTGNDVLTGGRAADTLTGGDGNDVVVGGLGGDTVSLGSGIDTFSWVEGDGNDSVDGGIGTDTLRLTAWSPGDTLSLGMLTGSSNLVFMSEAETVGIAGIERIELDTEGGANPIVVGDLSGTGVTLVRIDTAGSAGGTAAIDLAGSAAGTNITLTLDGAVLVATGLAARVEMTSLGGGSSVQVLGLGGNDRIDASTVAASIAVALDGGDGNDVLLASESANMLSGGADIDTVSYVASNNAVMVNLAAGTGFGGYANDDIYSGVENAIGSAFGDILNGEAGANALDGREGNDQIYGRAGNDVLNGGAGIDCTDGGMGDDVHHVDSAADLVVERVGEGTADKVLASASYALTDAMDIEILAAASASATTALDLKGNALNNTIQGNAGANLLDGGAGADSMKGSGGDDTYVVDNIGDKVGENVAGEGVDTVRSSVTFVLGQFVENLVLTGTGAINGTGSAFGNSISGNDAANVLNGGEGADLLAGGKGDDTYVVDSLADVVTEVAAGGIDTVKSSVRFTLGAEVENLVLTGSASIAGTGNALENKITGNAAANTIDGSSGADTMAGGAGDDLYGVDNVADKVVEGAGGGFDTVKSFVSFSLAGQQIESLQLKGSAAINGTGNGLDNVIGGNAAANSLSGGIGADQLYGRGGNDTLDGGTGADSFYFDAALNAATNVDTIAGFSIADDTIMLDRTIFSGIAVSGELAAGAFVVGTAAADADDRILYDSGTGKIFYDADGSGQGAALLFAQVAAGTALTSADFTAYAPA